MDPVFIRFEKQRSDNFLTYIVEDKRVLLTTLCIRINSKTPKTSIFAGQIEIIRDYKTHGKDILVYKNNKVHTNLYSDGYDVIDGYGQLWKGVQLRKNILITKKGEFHVHTNQYKDIDVFEENIKNKNPSNVFGPIPESEVIISEDTDFLTAFSLTGLDAETVKTFYSQPSVVKKQIDNDINLSMLKF